MIVITKLNNHQPPVIACSFHN